MSQKLSYFLFLFICFSLNTFLNAQTQNDSLAKYSYEELRAFRKNYRNSNNELSKVYIDEYLKRSIVDNDTVRIYTGYFFLSKYYGNKGDLNPSTQYLDSVIKYSENKQDKYLPALAYKNKGAYLYNLGKNNEALENFLKALEVLKTNKNVSLEIDIRSAIISVRSNWSLSEEDLNFKKETLEFVINNKEFILDYTETYFVALSNLSLGYLRNKKYKQGLEIAKKGIQETIHIKDTISYYDFVTYGGYAQYYLENYQIAIDSLQKALPYRDDHGKAMNNYYLGKSYDKLNQPEKAQFHFLKTDSIYQATKDIFPEMRIAYEHIIDYYKSKNDTENQIKYYDRLLETDKIIDSTYTYVTETIEKKYETPEAIAERARLVEELETKKNAWKYRFGAISAILLVILGI
ncbi:tetratricopeptide repeat protein, partial [Kordia sp.]|uniref:tetratricopeptide repeat protein n=1 Tax=Kordia sp. TaxID=1965332 RepID=UPI003D6AAA39